MVNKLTFHAYENIKFPSKYNLAIRQNHTNALLWTCHERSHIHLIGYEFDIKVNENKLDENNSSYKAWMEHTHEFSVSMEIFEQ